MWKEVSDRIERKDVTASSQYYFREREPYEVGFDLCVDLVNPYVYLVHRTQFLACLQNGVGRNSNANLC